MKRNIMFSDVQKPALCQGSFATSLVKYSASAQQNSPQKKSPEHEPDVQAWISNVAIILHSFARSVFNTDYLGCKRAAAADSRNSLVRNVIAYVRAATFEPVAPRNSLSNGVITSMYACRLPVHEHASNSDAYQPSVANKSAVNKFLIEHQNIWNLIKMPGQTQLVH